MGDTVTAEIVKRRDRGLLDESLNIRGVAFTNGGINFKYAKLRLAQWALRLPFGIGEGINRLFIILGKFAQTETGSKWIYFDTFESSIFILLDRKVEQSCFGLTFGPSTFTL